MTGVGKYWKEGESGEKGEPEGLKGNSVGPFVVPVGPILDALKDSEGHVPGDVGYVGPTVQTVPGNVCVASITETDLTDNVYTVTGEPAKRIELINDGAGELTVTISDGTNTTSKVLKPDDVYDQNFTAITTLTFSTGAVFRADILR